jgi:hypothetical protein
LKIPIKKETNKKNNNNERYDNILPKEIINVSLKYKKLE